MAREKVYPPGSTPAKSLAQIRKVLKSVAIVNTAPEPGPAQHGLDKSGMHRIAMGYVQHPRRKRFQFSIRSLFAVTTVLSATYASLNWFGVMAHVAVWATFLIVGPILGILLGIRKLNEPNPIVNGVQAGSLGGAAGYAGALLLLAPAYAESTYETLCVTAFMGTVVAFLGGGGFGLAVGCVRWLGTFQSAELEAKIDHLKQQPHVLSSGDCPFLRTAAKRWRPRFSNWMCMALGLVVASGLFGSYLAIKSGPLRHPPPRLEWMPDPETTESAASKTRKETLPRSRSAPKAQTL